MRSRKGIAVGYIVLLILALAIGITALLISKPIYESITHELDTFCVIENSLKEIANIEPFYEVSSKGSCKTSKITVRAVDMSKELQIQRNCPELIDDFGDDLDRWIEENPTLAVQECAKSKIMYSAEKCWRSYLEGEAGFGNKCSELCLAPGFLSYEISGRSGEITFPKIENSQLFIFEGIFNPNTFTLTEYDFLTPLDADIKEDFFEEFQESNTETTQTIRWKLGGGTRYSLVVQIPIAELSPSDLIQNKFPLSVVGRELEDETVDKSMNSGEKWSIEYVGYDTDYLPAVDFEWSWSPVGFDWTEESYIIFKNEGIC